MPDPFVDYVKKEYGLKSDEDAEVFAKEILRRKSVGARGPGSAVKIDTAIGERPVAIDAPIGAPVSDRIAGPPTKEEADWEAYSRSGFKTKAAFDAHRAATANPPSPVPSMNEFYRVAAKPMPKRTPEEAEAFSRFIHAPEAMGGTDPRPRGMVEADLEHFRKGVQGTGRRVMDAMNSVGTVGSLRDAMIRYMAPGANTDPWNGPVKK